MAPCCPRNGKVLDLAQPMIVLNSSRQPAHTHRSKSIWLLWVNSCLLRAGGLLHVLKNVLAATSLLTRCS